MQLAQRNGNALQRTPAGAGPPHRRDPVEIYIRGPLKTRTFDLYILFCWLPAVLEWRCRVTRNCPFRPVALGVTLSQLFEGWKAARAARHGL